MAIQTGESLAKVLRGLLEAPGIHQGPVCYDALSAKLVEKAGFPFCFTGGMSLFPLMFVENLCHFQILDSLGLVFLL